MLGGCKALTRLGLRHNRIGAEGAERLAECWGSARRLFILTWARTGLVPGERGVWRRVLSENKTLTHLNLSKNRISDYVAGRLSGVEMLGNGEVGFGDGLEEDEEVENEAEEGGEDDEDETGDA